MNEFPNAAWLIVVNVTLGIFVGCHEVFRLHRGGRNSKLWNYVLTILMSQACAGVSLTYVLLAGERFNAVAALVGLVGTSLCVGLLITAMLAENGVYLTERYGKTWVKALDFPYLALALFGFLRIVNSAPTVQGRIDGFEAFGVFALSLAVGFRLSKTMIEVFFEKHITPVADIMGPKAG